MRACSQSAQIWRECENLKELDSLRDKGLIPQLFAFGKKIVEIIHEKIVSGKPKQLLRNSKNFQFPSEEVKFPKRNVSIGWGPSSHVS